MVSRSESYKSEFDSILYLFCISGVFINIASEYGSSSDVHSGVKKLPKAHIKSATTGVSIIDIFELFVVEVFLTVEDFLGLQGRNSKEGRASLVADNSCVHATSRVNEF